MVLVIPACSGGTTPPGGDRTRLGGSEEPNSKNKKEVRKKAAQIGERAEASGKGGGTGEGTSAKVAGEPPDNPTFSSEINPAFARRTAVVDDSASDSKREGITPSYAEATRASIIGLGEDFKLTMTFAGDVPSAMPNDKTHMIVAFGITGSNEEEGYSFGAQCTTEGWQAYAGGKDDTSEFPGTLEVSGNTIVMVVPWDYIRGPRAFEWYAASNWFSQVANVTNYRVDLVPNEGLSKFPK
jgi:hypothetical protein